ncbi:MAG: sigma 54-interacting transcriptional regulator [bacterium]
METDKILFLCTGNSARSQMAEAFARAQAPRGVEVFSAGIAPAGVNPLAVKAMAEIGFDISSHVSKDLAALPTRRFDVVVTLCDHARQVCPVVPGANASIHWNLPDPAAASGSENERLEAFRRSRDRIRALVDDFFNRGYFAALASMKRSFKAVLDNLTDGIIVHDNQRTIVHFNSAAERITGFAASEVLGRDCREVFPGGLCAEKCRFRDGIPGAACAAYSLNLVTRDGETRRVEMSVVPMIGGDGAPMGVIASFRDVTRLLELEKELGRTRRFAGIIGSDAKMQEVFALIAEVADTDVPVLIQGETGTGKELVAAAVHGESRRAGALFVPVNCAALPEGIIESELFGHVRGAFTGAVRDKKGRFELADGGTIFLDEVGELSPAIQVKLLRVLQEGTFERVGGDNTIKVNVRVISATNRDLMRLVADGAFRQDLFYRLCVVPVTIPPLRERRGDVPLLAEHFLMKAAEGGGADSVVFSRDAVSVLMDYHWPGNVRQLQNAVQYALVKCREGVIKPEHLPPEIVIGRRVVLGKKQGPRFKLTGDRVRDALEKSGGNKAKAAKILGVGRATLYRHLSRRNNDA